MLQLLGGRWERNPAAEQRICGRRPAQIAVGQKICFLTLFLFEFELFLEQFGHCFSAFFCSNIGDAHFALKDLRHEQYVCLT